MQNAAGLFSFCIRFSSGFEVMFIKPLVMKFGGTSIEDTPAFARTARIIGAQRRAQPVIIVSAMSRMTDALVRSVALAQQSGNVDEAFSVLAEHFARHTTIAQTLLNDAAQADFQVVLEKAEREVCELLEQVRARAMPLLFLQDVIVAYGEQLSAVLLTAVLQANELPAQCVDARRCITTNEEHGNAAPLTEETGERTRRELAPLIEAGRIPVLGGFIAATQSGATTTLGRGGSDYSAAIIGAAIDAREIEIWSDVTGVLTADPRIVKNARTVPSLTYEEAAELAYFGAKVLHPKTIQPAVERGIPVRVRNSRQPLEAGTIIFTDTDVAPHSVKAIAHKTGITTLQITSARMLGAYGFLRAVFEIFDKHRIIVDVVTTSEVSLSLSVDDPRALPAIIPELQQLGAVEIEGRRAIIAVIGEGLRATPGLAARVFSTISDINIPLISLGASSVNLTFIVAEENVNEAVNRLHRAYFERGIKGAATA